MDLLHTALAFFVVFGLLGSLYFYANHGRKRRVPLRLGLGFFFRSKLSRKVASVPPRELEVIRRVNLTPTHQLHLIATDTGRFLLCTHTQGCSLLSSPAKASKEFPFEILANEGAGEHLRAN